MLPRLFNLHQATILKLLRLQKEAEQDGAYRVAKRIHSVILCAKGHTSGEISDLLQSPRSKVSLWLKNYEEFNFEGLLEGYRCGRSPELSEKNRNQLADIIESGPVAYGFLSGVWTSPMITRVIEEEFGIKYHPGHVRKLLHALHFSVQRPKRQLAKADPNLMERWRRYIYPQIKKKPKADKRQLSSKTKPVSAKTQPSIKPGHAKVVSH